MNPSLTTLSLALIILGGFAVALERREWSLRKLSLLTAITSLAALTRIPFAAVPGLQPTTFLIILTGYVFGPASGFLVGGASAFVSNAFLGQGPWTIWQVTAWALCGFSAGLLRQVAPGNRLIVLIPFGILWGFLFGWIMNLWHWMTFVFPLNGKTWLATNAASLPFDALHAAGNAVFLFFGGRPFLRILERFRDRVEITAPDKNLSNSELQHAPTPKP